LASMTQQFRVGGRVFGYREDYDFTNESNGETDPDGWSYWEEASGGAHTDGYVMGSYGGYSKVLYMYDGQDWPAQNQWSHVSSFNWATLTVEFDANINITGESYPVTERLQIGIHGDAVGPWILLYNGGTIYRYNSSGSVVQVGGSGAFTEGSWQHWKFVISVYTQSFDLYVGGSLVASNIPFYYTNEPNYFSSIYIRSHFKTWGSHYFDNFELYGNPPTGQVRMEGTVQFPHEEQIKVEGEISAIDFSDEIRVDGEIDDIAHNEQFRMDGETLDIPHEEQVRMDGEIDYIPHNEQFKMGGETSEIPLNDQIKMDGEIDYVPYNNQFKVDGETSAIEMSEQIKIDGEIDYAVLKEQFRVDGETSAIPVSEGVRVDGETTPIEMSEQIKIDGYLDYIPLDGGMRMRGLLAGNFLGQIRASGIVPTPLNEQIKIEGMTDAFSSKQFKVEGEYLANPVFWRKIIDLTHPNYEFKLSPMRIAEDYPNQLPFDHNYFGRYAQEFWGDPEPFEFEDFDNWSGETSGVDPDYSRLSVQRGLRWLKNWETTTADIVPRIADDFGFPTSSSWGGHRIMAIRLPSKYTIKDTDIVSFKVGIGAFSGQYTVRTGDPVRVQMKVDLWRYVSIGGGDYAIQKRQLADLDSWDYDYEVGDNWIRKHEKLDNIAETSWTNWEVHPLPVNEVDAYWLVFREINAYVTVGDDLELALDFYYFRAYTEDSGDFGTPQVKIEGFSIGYLEEGVKSEGTVASIEHWDNVKTEGTIDWIEGTQQVRMDGITQEAHESAIKMEGSVSSIPRRKSIKVEGTIAYIPHGEQVKMEGVAWDIFHDQVRVVGEVSGISHEERIKIEGETSEVSYLNNIRVDGETDFHPHADQVKAEGEVAPFPFYDQSRVDGEVVPGNEFEVIRCEGFLGPRPRRPPLDMRMTMDLFRRRMRSSVTLYHYDSNQGTTNNGKWRRPEPEEYDLTPYCVFVNTDQPTVDMEDIGAQDTFQAYLVVDSSRLPSGLPEINEAHDIIEYEGLKYRFYRHSKSYEEWYGLVEYKLASMYPYRNYGGIIHDSFIGCTGYVSGASIIGGIQVRGYVAEDYYHTIGVTGQVANAGYNRNVKMFGYLAQIDVEEGIEIVGSVSAIPHYHNAKVEGEIIYASLKDGMKVEGEFILASYDSGIKLEGETGGITVSEQFKVEGYADEIYPLSLDVMEDFFIRQSIFSGWRPQWSHNKINAYHTKKWDGIRGFRGIPECDILNRVFKNPGIDKYNRWKLKRRYNEY